MAEIKRKGVIIMNNDKIVLADNTEITLEWSQGIGALHVNAATIAGACEMWEKFTPAALKEVAVKNADGLTVGKYQDMVLDHVTGTENKDGTIQMVFCLRGKTAEETLMERLAACEAVQQTQDAAIGDLGQAVSDMVEGGGR